MNELTTYKASQIKTLIKSCWNARANLMIWGPPGIGKSAVVQQAALELSEELGKPFQVVDRRLATEEPCDAKGLPGISDGRTVWAQPHWFPTDPDSCGIIFEDELPQAPTATQNAALELAGEERSLNGVKLPDGWVIVAAGNRIKDRAGAGKVTSALAGRFCHVEMAVDLDDWTGWAIENGIRPEVVAFNRFKKSALHDFDPARDELAYASPRAWTRISQLMEHVPAELLHGACAGSIGTALATEFSAFIRVWKDLPNPDAVLLKPGTADIPTKVDVLYALVGALCMRVNDQNADRFMRFAIRLKPEWSVLAVDYAMRTKASKAVMHCQEFTVWSLKHKDLLFA